MVLPNSGVDLKAIVAAFENHLVDQALARTGGNKTARVSFPAHEPHYLG